MEAVEDLTKKACEDLVRYCEMVLNPAATQFLSDLENNAVSLHQAYSVTMFAAHAMDYIHAIRAAKGDKISRADLLKEFDDLFEIEGAQLSNRKFQLINSINNSLKHIEIDGSKPSNSEAIKQYGPIRFGSLVEKEGKVICNLQHYWFDFGRVVLRPVLQELANLDLEDQTYIEDFATGDLGYIEISMIDEDDPIDKMIEYCNPDCLNCGEAEGECDCKSYVFDKSGGRFEPIPPDSRFNFDDVMSQISGAY